MTHRRLLPTIVTLAAVSVHAQVTFTGRVRAPRFEGSTDVYEFAAIYVFGSCTGSEAEAIAHRTWEMYPRSWYICSGSSGNYTLLFADPADFMRPILLTNQYGHDGDVLDRVVSPRLDFACFHETSWDEQPANGYYQPFTASGTSVTHVGFKLAHDGVDGEGPAGQDILISVHRQGSGTPDTWEQVGQTVLAPNVDCGGVKGYHYSAGWNSGEAPTTPGETYAVFLRPASKAGSFQALWRPLDSEDSGCFRVAGEEKGYTGHELWLAVGSDCDGLLIPYNKTVHREYQEFAGFARSWTQTYIAQGRSLASVILYAAVSGTQPSQNRQRVRVVVRDGAPNGPVVGTPKIAIGNAIYTGDASWGTFGLTYAPGEVPLEPGRTYAIEFTSIETWETLHGFTNIKGQGSEPDPGFNPYRKVAPDTCDDGTAWFQGREQRDFDLDMQVIEYAELPRSWSGAVLPENLIDNGDMEKGELADEPADAIAEGWKPFAVDPGTIHHYLADGQKQDNRILRVIGGGFSGTTVDGGYVQEIDGLSSLETYRLTGKVRCSWPIDARHLVRIGYDPTGQADDPQASTIVWTLLPPTHGVFVPYRTADPIRPRVDGISVWMRAWTDLPDNYPFRADLDDFALYQVDASIPRTPKR